MRIPATLLRMLIAGSAIVCFIALWGMGAGTEIIEIRTLDELQASLKRAVPGSRIEIAPGTYRGGIRISNLHGKPGLPIEIVGMDPRNPPVFEGTGEGLKASICSYVRFKNIVFRDYPDNGINVDDGGRRQTSHHIILEDIRIENIGPMGNNDALKMSGVDHFVVRNLHAEGWGGSAVDLVGCHFGVIEQSRFIHKKGCRSGNGIQIKGGSHSVLVQNNHFMDAIGRGVQIGGLTGLKYFRPTAGNYEARNVIVAGNTFMGGNAPIVWVTSRDSQVHNNLFYMPKGWLGRILQETSDPRFMPCGGGRFEKNVIVLDSAAGGIFNIGRGTDPRSFILHGNVWNRSESEVKQHLPAVESGGIYGFHPELRVTPGGGIAPAQDSPVLRDAGPWAYESQRVASEYGDIRLRSHR